MFLFLSLVSSNWDMMYQVWILLGSFYLGWKLIESVGLYVSQDFGRKFSVIIFSIFSCTVPVFCLSGGAMHALRIFLHRYFEVQFVILNLFHLRCADWIVSIEFLQFTSSFVTCILYWVYQWACNFSYCIQFSVLKFLFDSFLMYSVSWLRISISFLFISRVFALYFLRHFYTILKCLSAISSILVCLRVGICELSFPIKRFPGSLNAQQF